MTTDEPHCPSSQTTKMIVACAGERHTRFDRDYYTNNHLALTMQRWGLRSIFSPL